MRSLVSASILALSVSIFAQGCAADDTTPEDESGDAVSAASKAVSGTNATVLNDLLMKADAPSSTPAGMVGVGSRIARVALSAKGGTISTVAGVEIASLTDAGGTFEEVRAALVAGGVKETSSGSLLAKVECKRAVTPTAKPACTVTPIAFTQADAETLWKLLGAANAPSNTPAGMVGSGSRIAILDLSTQRGDLSPLFNEYGTVSTVAGKKLGEVEKLGVAWASVETALLDAGLSWSVNDAPAGSVSRSLTAKVVCTRAVTPTAKPSCSVTEP